jgi:thiol-disulfide isomerase/thioredoxin
MINKRQILRYMQFINDRKLCRKIFSLIMFCFVINTNCFAQKLFTDTKEIVDFKTLKNNKASIVIFFDPECPICQKYTKNLRELEQKYGVEGIKLYIVYPFKVLDSKSLAEFREEFQFDLPIIYDSKRKLLKRMKANYSPEIFLLDNKRKTLYHGAIDNWFYGLGQNRAKPTEFYLLDAIESYKNNQEIKVKYIEPVGCML